MITYNAAIVNFISWIWRQF